MRRHSRWTVAAVTAVLALALASPAGAKAHRRTHANTPPPAAAAAPPAETPPAPTSGVRPSSAEVAPPPAAAATGKGAMAAASIDPRDVEAILGKSVRSSAGEDMGRLVDVVVDREEGRPRAAIIDFGGFLGVGSRKIAVDWGALKFAPKDEKGQLITVELTRDQVKAAPEFKEGSSVVVLGPGAAPGPNPAPKPQAQDQPQAQEK